MLPGFWRAIGFWLPPGAGVRAETGAVYFQGTRPWERSLCSPVYAGVAVIAALAMGGRRQLRPV
jgi:hypothetical protein